MMMDLCFLATTDGVLTFKRQNEAWSLSGRELSGLHATSAATQNGLAWVGTTQGIYRSDDQGKTWQDVNDGLALRHVRWIAVHPTISQLLFAGTEPAGIFRSQNGARTWEACPEVAQLRQKYRWYLPYSPQAGCVRDLAFHGVHAYAAVEVGGMLRSQNNGRSWHLVGGSTGSPSLANIPAAHLHPDVHSVQVHPASPDLVYAPTGDGFFVSDDGGETWDQRYRNCYCRAVWIDHEDPKHLILGPADSVDRGGRIEQSRDGGRTWNQASVGLDTPWRQHMVERFFQIGDQLWAVLSNGDLIAAPLKTLQWDQILPGTGRINALAVMRAQGA